MASEQQAPPAADFCCPWCHRSFRTTEKPSVVCPYCRINFNPAAGRAADAGEVIDPLALWLSDWTCSDCGTRVVGGTYHDCKGGTMVNPPPVPQALDVLREEVRKLTAERDLWKARVEGLELFLPKSADGVTIYPGMTVYRRVKDGSIQDLQVSDVHQWGVYADGQWDGSELYSTRAAAQPPAGGAGEEGRSDG